MLSCLGAGGAEDAGVVGVEAEGVARREEALEGGVLRVGRQLQRLHVAARAQFNRDWRRLERRQVGVGQPERVACKHGHTRTPHLLSQKREGLTSVRAL